jgi:hypothetical protein
MRRNPKRLPILLLVLAGLVAIAATASALPGSSDDDSAKKPAPRLRTALPNVPSLAKGASPARMRFVRRVDATCADTYAVGIRRSEAMALKLGDGPQAQLRVYGDYLDWHAAQVAAVRRLGPPPEAAGLYRAWLENMARREAQERRALSRHVAGKRAAAARDYAQVGRLKQAGDLAGRRFGLQRCTSSGSEPAPGVR